MNAADYLDLSNPTTRWALYVAGFALVLVLLAAILAKLGLKKVSLPAWLGGALVGMIVGGVAVGAYVYITKPVEIPPNPMAGEEYDGGNVGMSEGAGGSMGGDMMALGGMSATMPGGMGGPGGPGGRSGGGRIPPRVRAMGLLNGLDLLAGSYAFGLVPEQAEQLVELLEPIKGTGINDDNAEQIAGKISEILSEEQLQLLRRIRPARRNRRGQGGGFDGGSGGPGGPGMASGPGAYPSDYPGMRPPQKSEVEGAEAKAGQAQPKEATEEADPSVELVNRLLGRLKQLATSEAASEPAASGQEK